MSQLQVAAWPLAVPLRAPNTRLTENHRPVHGKIMVPALLLTGAILVHML